MLDNIKALLDKLPRMIVWTIICLALTLVIALYKPYLLPTTLYKLSLVACGGVIGYWLDREVFKGARLSTFLIEVNGSPPMIAKGCELAYASAQLRRALIVAACAIAVCLGA